MSCPGQQGTAIDRKMAITSTVKRRLREIDRRIRFLSKRLEIAQVVDPTQQKNLDQVFFGATVTYAHERGTERTITIVGVGRGRSRSWPSELGIAYSASTDEGA